MGEDLSRSTIVDSLKEILTGENPPNLTLSLSFQENPASNGDSDSLKGKNSRDLTLSRTFQGNTALHITARAGKEGTGKKTESEREKTERATMKEDLYRAASNGEVDKLEKILKGQNPPQLTLSRTFEGNTALHITARAGKEETAKMIIQECPSLLCQPNAKGDTPFHVAAKAGHLGLTMLLTETGGDLEGGLSTAAGVLWKVRNSEGNAPVHEAVKMGHKEVALYLMGLDKEHELVGEENEAGESLLYLAAEAGLWRITSEIIEGPPSFSIKGRNGQTPLHIAAMRGHGVIVEMLLTHDKIRKVVKEADRFGKTALHYAAFRCNDSLAQWITGLLMKVDPSVAYVSDNDGNFPMHIAAFEGSLVLEIMLYQSPQVAGFTDRNGRNALHLAAMNDYENVFYFERLTRFMQDFINEADNDGNTPLHLATMKRLPYNVSTLLRCSKTNKAATNKEGLTALDICELDHQVSPMQVKLHSILVKNNAANSSLPRKGRMDFTSRRKALVPPTSRLKSMAETLSILATLVATVTFAAAFTMPGGYNSNGPNEGLPVLMTKAAIKAFVVFDTLAFCGSMTVAFLLVWALMNKDPIFLGEAVSLSIIISWFAVCGTMFAFVAAMYVLISEESMALAVVIMILGSIVPFQAFFYRTYSNIKRRMELVRAKEEDKCRVLNACTGEETKPSMRYLLFSTLFYKWRHNDKMIMNKGEHLRWYYLLPTDES